MFTNQPIDSNYLLKYLYSSNHFQNFKCLKLYLEQLNNLGNYIDIYCANAREDENSYILAIAKEHIDVYSKSKKPTLLFLSKRHHNLFITAFSEYNEEEQLIPLTSLLHTPVNKFIYGAYKISNCQLEYYEIDNNIFLENFKQFPVVNYMTTIGDNMLLINADQSLLRFKYSTYPLRMQTSSLKLDGKYLLSTFPIPGKDKLLLLTYNEYKKPYNRELKNNKMIKNYNTYTFVILDKIKWDYCSFEKEDLNIKEKSITYFLQNDNIIKAIQDPYCWHRFVLFSKSHIYKIDLKEIYKEVDRIVIGIDKISVDKRNRFDIKYALMNKTNLFPEIESCLEGKHTPYSINIDNQNFMLFFREGFIINYKLNDNIFLILCEFYLKDRYTIRVVELYRDKDIILVWMDYSDKYNTIIKINRLFEKNNNLDMMEVMSNLYLPYADSIKSIQNSNALLVSSKGNLYQVNDMVAGNKDKIKACKLDGSVIFIERKLNNNKLYQITNDRNNIENVENIITINQHDDIRYYEGFELSITNKRSRNLLIIKNNKENYTLGKKLYFRKLELNIVIFYPLDFFIYKIYFYLINEYAKYYSAAIIEKEKEMYLIELEQKEDLFSFPIKREGILFSKFITTCDDQIINILSTNSTIYCTTIKNRKTMETKIHYMERPFWINKRDLQKNKDIITISSSLIKLRNDLLQPNIKDRTFLIYKETSFKTSEFNIIETEGLQGENEHKYINQISIVKKLTNFEDSSQVREFHYCQHLNVLYYYHKGLRMIDIGQNYFETTCISQENLLELEYSDWKFEDLYNNFLNCNIINNTHIIVIGLVNLDKNETMRFYNDSLAYQIETERIKYVEDYFIERSKGIMCVAFTSSTDINKPKIQVVKPIKLIFDALFYNKSHLVLSIDKDLEIFKLDDNKIERIGKRYNVMDYYRLSTFNDDQVMGNNYSVNETEIFEINEHLNFLPDSSYRLDVINANMIIYKNRYLVYCRYDADEEHVYVSNGYEVLYEDSDISFFKFFIKENILYGVTQFNEFFRIILELD